jgi:hypothetical protein
MKGSSMVRWAVQFKGRFIRVGTANLYSLFLTRKEAEESFVHAVESSKYRAVKVKIRLTETTEGVNK